MQWVSAYIYTYIACKYMTNTCSYSSSRFTYLNWQLSSEVVSSVNWIAKNWSKITMALTNSAHGQAAH